MKPTPKVDEWRALDYASRKRTARALFPDLSWSLAKRLFMHGYRSYADVARATDRELLTMQQIGRVHLAEARRYAPYNALSFDDFINAHWGN